MIIGETASGFKFQLEDSALNNMELVDALADLHGDNVLAISRVTLLLLGEDQRARLYDHLRAEDGTVPADAVSAELGNIMKAAGEQAKK